MVKRNGGYAIVVHDDANIYNEVKTAYENHKPILFYDDDNTCYFIDSIKKDNDDYVLTKGGKTFTVTTNNTLSSEGYVVNPTMENIKDLNGNLRFVEGDITTRTISGVTFNYAKWSLSGSHLMCIIAGVVDDTTVISNGTILADFTIPEYIGEKITPLIGTTDYIGYKNELFFTEGSISNPQTAIIVLSKGVDNNIKYRTGTSLTASGNKTFRIQFDFLIDAE